MPASLPDKRAYSIAESAIRLSVSTATVRRLISDGTIRTIRLGRRVLIPVKIVEQLCEPTD